jgi:hypothetical protein
MAGGRDNLAARRDCQRPPLPVVDRFGGQPADRWQNGAAFVGRRSDAVVR